MSSLLIESSDFHLYRLKYVLMMYLVRQVVWADDIVDPSEIQFVRDHFPTSVLAALDLLDTGTHQQLLEEALRVLPDVLSTEAKHEIVGICFAASAVDGQVDPREVAVVQVAAETLKIPPEELFDLIRALLDDPSIKTLKEAAGSHSPVDALPPPKVKLD